MSRQSILDRLTDEHETRINRVLINLEEAIVSSIVSSTGGDTQVYLTEL